MLENLCSQKIISFTQYLKNGQERFLIPTQIIFLFIFSGQTSLKQKEPFISFFADFCLIRCLLYPTTSSISLVHLSFLSLHSKYEVSDSFFVFWEILILGPKFEKKMHFLNRPSGHNTCGFIYLCACI